MNDEEQTYCRLCAEPTPNEQLLSIDEAAGVNSKIAKKMQWINIDISKAFLPNTICFACFDALERTWKFLQEARLAQVKLHEIFTKKLPDSHSKTIDLSDAGKPVNTDWEEFQTKAEAVSKDFEVFQTAKTEIKSENTTEHPRIDREIDLTDSRNSPSVIWESDLLEIRAIGPSVLINVDSMVKKERISNDHDHSDGHNSTDSDLPLLHAVQKRKEKKKKIRKIEMKNAESCYKSLTWEEYMCRCAYCDALCKNITSLRLHTLQIHTCCCSFKCSECGQVISNYRSFLRHVRLHKKFLRRCCEFCNKRFSSSTSLKIHINMYHCDAYLLMCQSCGASFDSQELLQDHIIIYSRKYKKRSVKCEQMDYDLKCDLCNKEFKTKSNLQQHRLVHMERTREFSCHVCGKMFFTKGSLSTHISTHEDSKPYKCEFCPMAFRARGNLQSHKSLHSGIKPFVCEQCGKSFRVKRHLKSHSIVHTDLMPYVCQYCNKTFRFKTRLNLHLRQHTGVKPYKCDLCQRDFTNGSNYKKHMKRRHNIDTSRKKYNNIVRENMDSKEEIISQS